MVMKEVQGQDQVEDGPEDSIISMQRMNYMEMKEVQDQGREDEPFLDNNAQITIVKSIVN